MNFWTQYDICSCHKQFLLYTDILQFQNSPKLIIKKSGLKRKAVNELPRPKKRPLLEENVDHYNRGSVMGTRRRSARLQGNVRICTCTLILGLEALISTDKVAGSYSSKTLLYNLSTYLLPLPILSSLIAFISRERYTFTNT